MRHAVDVVLSLRCFCFLRKQITKQVIIADIFHHTSCEGILKKRFIFISILLAQSLNKNNWDQYKRMQSENETLNKNGHKVTMRFDIKRQWKSFLFQWHIQREHNSMSTIKCKNAQPRNDRM